MCVIVDANVKTKFFGEKVAAEFLVRYVLEQMRPSGRPIPLALGEGRHIIELFNKGALKTILGEIKRRPKASNLLKIYESSELAREERKLPPVEQCKSKKGDRHILALARVSGSRLLVTADKGLKEDFWSKKIVSAVTWGDGKNKGGKILPLGRNRSQKQKRQELFETMPRCTQRHLRGAHSTAL